VNDALILVAQETVQVSPWNWVIAGLAAVGGGGGLFGAWHGYTRDKRTQRLEQSKADRLELQQERAERQRLEREIQELGRREWDAQREKTTTLDLLARTQSRLSQVEEDLRVERAKTARLERRVAELEGGSPSQT
jgi:hypothetical protein